MLELGNTAEEPLRSEREMREPGTLPHSPGNTRVLHIAMNVGVVWRRAQDGSGSPKFRMIWAVLF